MIGNDIIDLQLAARESNWQRRGYLDKIYTPAEQAMIHASSDADKMVWLLWSCKEAVYKIVHRETGVHAYNPLKFHCKENTVVYNDQIYFTQSTVSASCIYTVAVSKKILLNSIRTVDEIEGIVKDVHGIPYLNGQPASCTHHGRFKATLLLLPG